jgi:predicted nucleotidyltransferase/HEPN domain-containing protein
MENMKTKLPKRSLLMKDRLEAITKAILDVAKDKIAMIILFGSYARGDWVEDEYMEDHITYTYQSDLDIMLVMKKGKYCGYQWIETEAKITKLLEFLRLDPIPSYLNFKTHKPPIALVSESIASVTKGLEKGRYFYTDIKKEGVMLYDSGEFKLPEPRILTLEEQKEIARNDYDCWYPLGYDFLNSCISDINGSKYNYRKVAFILHQATECFYNTILLVFSGYKPKLHDLKILKGRVSQYSTALFKVFPLVTKEQRDCFTLLREAYIKARYDKTYKLTEEQLLYLIQRVKKLQLITENICQDKL